MSECIKLSSYKNLTSNDLFPSLIISISPRLIIIQNSLALSGSVPYSLNN